MADAADVSLHRRAAEWIARFIQEHPQTPEVEAEAAQLIADLKGRDKEDAERHAYWFDDYPLELLDGEIEELGGLPQNHPTRRLKVEFITRYRKARGILRGLAPRCDWFGYDGEQAQCPALGTKTIDGRHVCPEHFEVVEARDAWKRTHTY